MARRCGGSVVAPWRRGSKGTVGRYAPRVLRPMTTPAGAALEADGVRPFCLSPRLFAGTVPRVTFISVGGFIFLGAYEKARRTLL